MLRILNDQGLLRRCRTRFPSELARQRDIVRQGTNIRRRPNDGSHLLTDGSVGEPVRSVLRGLGPDHEPVFGCLEEWIVSTVVQQIHHWIERAEPFTGASNSTTSGDPIVLPKLQAIINEGIQLRRAFDDQKEIVHLVEPTNGASSTDGAEIGSSGTSAATNREARGAASEVDRPALESGNGSPIAVLEDAPIRQELVDHLDKLQDFLLEHVEELDPEHSDHGRLSRALEDQLREDQRYLSHLLTDHDPDSARTALNVERFRDDLHYRWAMVNRLEGQPTRSRAISAGVEVERLYQSIQSQSPSSHLEQVRAQIAQDCIQIRAQLLGRRLGRELEAIADQPPRDALGCWDKIFLLTRLQSQVDALPTEAQPDEKGESFNGTPDQWSCELAATRERLAEQAAEFLGQLNGPKEASAQWSRLIEVLGVESNDIDTLLETQPPEQSLRLLQLHSEDLVRLREMGSAFSQDHDKQLPREQRFRRGVKTVRKLQSWTRNQFQERALDHRMRRIFGDRFVDRLDALIIILILVVTAQIFFELSFQEWIEANPVWEARLAWFDLALSLVFLSEFGTRLALVQGRFRYFRRNFLIDFFAVLPYGFFAYQAKLAEQAMLVAGGSQTLSGGSGLQRGGGLLRLLRLIRVIRPIMRLGRLFVFAVRFTDRLVSRYQNLLNRQIVFFEPRDGEEADSRRRFLFESVREYYEGHATTLRERLNEADRLTIASLRLPECAARLRTIPPGSIDERSTTEIRVVRAEEVVERLVEITPERLVFRMGVPFVESINRYIRLLDLPIIRRLPLIEQLLANRRRGPAEVAALAVNYVGYAFQSIINLAYYFADLFSTITAPLFLDRLGNTLVKTTKRPAFRLVTLGLTAGVVYLVIQMLVGLQILDNEGPIQTFFSGLISKFGVGVLVLGAICFVLWPLGLWIKSLARQASERSERLVEAQFASQTRTLKLQDERQRRFLQERVLGPEISLREADDHLIERRGDLRELGQRIDHQLAQEFPPETLKFWEDVFQENVELLYRDYLQGALFHSSDTRTNTQLIGNVAVNNLRRHRLDYLLKKTDPKLEKLDLRRNSTALIGGPFVWFNYITQRIVQGTAVLIEEYNRNAEPRYRLAMESQERRAAYRFWLAQRLEIEPDQIDLPPVLGEAALHEPPNDEEARIRKEAQLLLRSVDFNATDFLADNPQRERYLATKYGDQLVDAIRRDRRANIRAAFQSYPLHRVPESIRTINLYVFYQKYLSGGKVFLVPLYALVSAFRLIIWGIGRVITTILHLLRPSSAPIPEPMVDTYETAVRKIHRMRKPAFMEALWFRANFDLEYLGLPLPDTPFSVSSDSLLETDLDYIGASRHERVMADQIRRQQAERLDLIGQWLRETGFDFPNLPERLARDFPLFARRSGEVIRALVTAYLTDYRDIASLHSAITGLRLMFQHAQNPIRPLAKLPHGLPEPTRLNGRSWYRSGKRGDWKRIFQVEGFQIEDPYRRRTVRRYLRKHWNIARPWIDLVLKQGGDAPLQVLQARLEDVVRETDLWSDQILALRTLQTMTILDVHHYIEMVYRLGGYHRTETTSTSSNEPLVRPLPFAWSHNGDESRRTTEKPIEVDLAVPAPISEPLLDQQ